MDQFVKRAAEIILKAGKIQKKKLPDPKEEALKMLIELKQIEDSGKYEKLFDQNANELLKRIKK